MADDFHHRLHHVTSGDLTESTAQTDGMRRREAISGNSVGSRNLWMGQTHVAPGCRSGNHHHGHSETAIHVLQGNPEFVFIDPSSGAESRIRTGPGDYVFVPPFVPHREENPDPVAEAVVVIARTTQEAIVVNLATLDGEPVP